MLCGAIPFALLGGHQLNVAFKSAYSMIPFDQIGRLPVAGDNVGIATRKLEAGLEFEFEGRSFALSHTVLEGHRFAVQKIEQGEMLTSWGMPFGTASRDIVPGAYVCNDGVIEALRGRSIDFALPTTSNFTDDIPAFDYHSLALRPAAQVAAATVPRFFEGYDRGRRGVGTRNYIAIIGVSSRTAGFVRRLARDCDALAKDYQNIDGVIPVAHTEGDDAVQNNKALVLRTLAGFLVHPNIGAALIVDHQQASVTGHDLRTFLDASNDPVEDVPHAFLTLDGPLSVHLEKGHTKVAAWFDAVNRQKRTRQSAAHLKIALQCGGSDAFSGISGNPLAGWVARAIIAQGGSANLAETDELIGAESYVLKRVKSEAVARRFLHVVNRFQNRAALHGASAAGNPSGGNKFRGLYNIYLKSLGAAMKRDPEVRLDAVIEYGERMMEPGYYFMDSPGNDLESIAGQVASGCNMIFFVTGNGSITNFPFVPTIKIVTTTQRFDYLSADMDVNAGAYLDGTPMDEVGQQMLNQTLDVASGEQSVGERAGHAQVQLWRNWRLEDKPSDEHLKQAQRHIFDEGTYAGVPIIGAEENNMHTVSSVANRIGLVMPTSLCSGQISKMAVDRLNASDIGGRIGVDQFVSLVHTEGCGASSGASEDLFLQTMCGHLLHQNVTHALLLEHGCEKTHNDYFRNFLEAEGIDTTDYGWASIQSDGGIEQVLNKVEHWFGSREEKEVATNNALSVGILTQGAASSEVIDGLQALAQKILSAGGSIVLPLASNVLPTSGGQVTGGGAYDGLGESLGIRGVSRPTLGYAQQIKRHGLHLMATPNLHLEELMTGLGATGVGVLIVASNGLSVPAHPFLPTLQIGDSGELDWVPGGDDSLFQRIVDTLRGEYAPVSSRLDESVFQISRGWRGISL